MSAVHWIRVGANEVSRKGFIRRLDTLSLPRNLASPKKDPPMSLGFGMPKTSPIARASPSVKDIYTGFDFIRKKKLISHYQITHEKVKYLSGTAIHGVESKF